MAGNQTFSLGIFVDVGSRHEGVGVQGAAHYLEHVLFKGTQSRTAEEISAAFDAVGGEVNAYTAKEHTCFYARVLADDAEIAIEILLDMLTHSLVTSQDVEAERSVILDEIAMHDDDPMELAHSLVAGALYGEHALGRDVIGSKASVTGLSRQQIASFWKRHYTPSDLVVAAAGNVDHDQLVARFAAMGGQPIERRRTKAPLAPAKPTLLVRTRPQEQVSCVLAFRGLHAFDEGRFALNLAALALGGGMSSRLFMEVRERRGLVYHIDATTHFYSDAGQLTIEWSCAPERVADIIALVSAQIADVVRHGLAEPELARVKGQIRGHTLLAFESADTRMMRIGRQELTGDPLSMNDILDRYEGVTNDEVRAVAHEVFVSEPVLAVVGPSVSRYQLDKAVAGWVCAVTKDA